MDTREPAGEFYQTGSCRRLYPTCEASGVEWLGDIPAHWALKRLRFACDINPRKSEIAGLPPDTEVSFLPMEKIGEDGTYVLDEIRTLDQVWQGYTYFRERDVVVAKITPCFENGKGALFRGLFNGIGFGTTELHVLRANADTCPEFVFHLTRLHLFRHLGNAMMHGTAGQQRVPENFIKDFVAGFPSLSEQRAIAAFLDRETARINALVAKQGRLIALLQEKCAALISHTVTKGLDPNVPMKDSGIPSIGLIPVHWETQRNKHVFEERDERSVAGEEELLSVSHITGVTPRSEKEVYMFMAESMEGYKLCHPGDLVINTMWAWMGALGVTEYEGIVSPSYHVYRLRKEHASEYVPKYLDLLYRTPVYVCEITRHSKGVWTSRLRLYPDSFFDIQTVTPPRTEQIQIVTHVSRQIQRMDELVDKSRQFIGLLQEYRTALISAAATGKIDVREEV